MNFKEWMLLQEDRGTAAKTGLYPLGYEGIGQYTPADWVTRAADAIYYLSQDERMFKTHEGPPFKITHIDGDVVEPRGHRMPGEEITPKGHGMPGTEAVPEYKMPPGVVQRPTQWVALVTHPKLRDPKDF